ncbi:hypothetical protein CRG98_015790 [Punica granatum]|uniref:Uncharacterized protein n=1 Tax=Punica granatum TaxID=22663 RepID=A0A2I0K7Y8_PUNGR|nr:hypothetical protein CRG98_015790 [Punica granatum]
MATSTNSAIHKRAELTIGEYIQDFAQHHRNVAVSTEMLLDYILIEFLVRTCPLHHFNAKKVRIRESLALPEEAAQYKPKIEDERSRRSTEPPPLIAYPGDEHGMVGLDKPIPGPTSQPEAPESWFNEPRVREAHVWIRNSSLNPVMGSQPWEWLGAGVESSSGKP